MLGKEIHKENGNIILFIDEIHTLVGAGKSDGAMDASNMLKPALEYCRKMLIDLPRLLAEESPKDSEDRGARTAVLEHFR